MRYIKYLLSFARVFFFICILLVLISSELMAQGNGLENGNGLTNDGFNQVDGFVNIYTKSDKVYLEIPENIFNRSILNTIIVSSSNHPKRHADKHLPYDKTFKLVRSEDFILAMGNKGKKIIDSNYQFINETDTLFKFPIIKENTNGSVVADFSNWALFPKLWTSLTDKIDSTRSRVIKAKCFENNLYVESQVTFQNKEAYSLVISLALLPDKPIKPRYDNNYLVGYFRNFNNVKNADGELKSKRAINRMRLELDEDDLDKYKAGVLVEPKEPIVFYVDNAFPDIWKPYIKEAILAWEEAFNGAGFKNAIQVRDFPVNDPDFDPYDMSKHVVKYIASSTPNGTGQNITDSRTGEIIKSLVIIHHNINKLLSKLHTLSQAQIDPVARIKEKPDSFKLDVIKYAICHEIGHALGLSHNFGSSHTIPVDSLRSATFTRQYNVTPSIMEYARFNYIAQPDDKGINLKTPGIGPYDKTAIEWGYRIFDNYSSDEEELRLDSILTSKTNPMEWVYIMEPPYGKEFAHNCYGLPEDLGDDPFLATKYGIENLKYVSQNIIEWNTGLEDDYKFQSTFYKNLRSRFHILLSNVKIVCKVGRNKIEVNEKFNKEPTQYISKEESQEAIYFVLNELRDFRKWYRVESFKKISRPENIITRIDYTVKYVIGDLLQSSFLVLNHEEYDGAISLEEYHESLYLNIWHRDKQTEVDYLMQEYYLIYVESIFHRKRYPSDKENLLFGIYRSIINSDIEFIEKKRNSATTEKERLHFQYVLNRYNQILKLPEIDEG